MSFINVSINEVAIQYNQNDRPILYSCNWCGNGAYKTVTRKSLLTENIYTDFVCDQCSKKWNDLYIKDFVQKGDNEMLTTKQMIDQLKEGQKAIVTNHIGYKAHIERVSGIKGDSTELKWKYTYSNGAKYEDWFDLDDDVMKLEWVIKA